MLSRTECCTLIYHLPFIICHLASEFWLLFKRLAYIRIDFMVRFRFKSWGRVAVLILGCLLGAVFQQTRAQVSFIAPGLFSKNDSLKHEHKEGVIIFPLLYYTPDTRFALGATGVYHFYSGNDYDSTRLSYIKLLADYTQNKQLDILQGFERALDRVGHLSHIDPPSTSFRARVLGFGQ